MEGGFIGWSKDNLIYVDDSSVSQEHAQILFINRNFYIKDLGSQTGTFLKI